MPRLVCQEDMSRSPPFALPPPQLLPSLAQLEGECVHDSLVTPCFLCFSLLPLWLTVTHHTLTHWNPQHTPEPPPETALRPTLGQVFLSHAFPSTPSTPGTLDIPL